MSRAHNSIVLILFWLEFLVVLAKQLLSVDVVPRLLGGTSDNDNIVQCIVIASSVEDVYAN